MKYITFSDMQQQSDAAARSPRLRAHRNFHPELTDPVQRLAIAMEPGTYIRPHRHPHTFELLLALSGRFVVLTFDDLGYVTRRIVLGEECTALEWMPGPGMRFCRWTPAALFLRSNTAVISRSLPGIMSRGLRRKVKRGRLN